MIDGLLYGTAPQLIFLEGLQEGFENGLEEGREVFRKSLRETAQQMIRNGFYEEEICEFLGIEAEKLHSLMAKGKTQ